MINNKKEYKDMFRLLLSKYQEKDVRRFSFFGGISRWDAEEIVSGVYYDLYDAMRDGKVIPNDVDHLHRIALTRCQRRCIDHIRKVTADKYVEGIPVEPENLDYLNQSERMRTTRQTLVILSNKKSIGSARQELLTDTFRQFCKTDTDKMFAEVLMNMTHANEPYSFDPSELARQCHELCDLRGPVDSTRRKAARFFERLRAFIAENRNLVEEYCSLTSLLA